MEAPQRDESLLAFPVIANHCQHLKAGLAAFLDGPYRAQGIRLACSEGRAAEAHQHCFRPRPRRSGIGEADVRISAH
jgi:hypothetical protein